MRSAEEVLQKHVPNRFPKDNPYINAMEEYANQFKEQPKKSIEERKFKFGKDLEQAIGQPRCYNKNTIEFFDYWTECSPNAKKMRFEKEKVFDIKKRLERWTRNQKQTINGTTTSEALNKFITE